MQDEYDFSRGVRGKHYRKYREGHNVIINVEDYDMMVEVLDRLIDEVGEDENHPLIAGRIYEFGEGLF